MQRRLSLAVTLGTVACALSWPCMLYAQQQFLPARGLPAGRSLSSSQSNSSDGVSSNATQRSGGQSTSSQEMLTMNFQDVDIGVLAKFISEITGKNIVLDESVRGKVSIISPTKVTPTQAYHIFQSVLQLKGFTTVEAGPVVKIVPLRAARESAAVSQAPMPGVSQGDTYVTRLVRHRHVDAAALLGVIQPLVSHEGLVAAFPQTNTLILTDNAWNVDRLLKVIGSLDVQGQHQQLEVIPLKLAYATDLAPEIEKIMGEKDSKNSAATYVRPMPGMAAASAVGPSQAFKIIPDERTNSLIVMAGPLQMEEIKNIIAKLDVHAPSATSRIHVYHLKYASALQMLDVINGLLGGNAPSQPAPQTGRGALGRMGGMGMASAGTMGSMGGLGGSFGGSMGGMGLSMGYAGGRGWLSGGGASAGVATTQTPTDSKHKGLGDFESQVRVTADPATNSLVITAGPQDYETLRNVIEQLDVPRRQVFVQAVVAEVSTNLQTNLGVSWQNFAGAGGSFSVGQLNFGQLAQTLANPAGTNGLAMGLVSGANCSVPASALGNLAGMAMGLSGAMLGGLGTLGGLAGYSPYGAYGGYSPYGYGYGYGYGGYGVYPGYGYGAYGGYYPPYAGTTNGMIPMPCDVALITALEQDSHSNVLSAPTLLTADNEEAQIVVGQNLPFLSSAMANAGLPGAIFNGVDRQNVGIMLDIVPQITDGGFVKLDLYEEVSAVVSGTENNVLGPTTTIRSASTSVVVENHHTAVIGGLLSDQKDTTKVGVPVLSNIPGLGALFSQSSKSRQKTNLLVFITPHIVLNGKDLQALALNERRKFIEALSKGEAKNMPRTQMQVLSQPGFAQPMSPAQELQSSQTLKGVETLPPVPAPLAGQPPSQSSGPATSPLGASPAPTQPSNTWVVPSAR